MFLKYIDVESCKLIKLPKLPKNIQTLKLFNNNLDEYPDVSEYKYLKDFKFIDKETFYKKKNK